MVKGLISWSLQNRIFVLVTAFAVAAIGVVSLNRLNIDAFPDTTPVQVQINTTAPSLVPEEIEKQITFPVELAISGLPGLLELRSVSMFGLSQVVAIFKDGTNIYFARQLINERLSTVELPFGIDRPAMGPISTGLGEVYHYFVQSDQRDMTELRTIHDWVIKPSMRRVSGAAEINSWGGLVKQYQVRIDPVRLLKYDVSFDQVTDAIKHNNLNVGGGSINPSSAGEMLLVHGIGRTLDTEQIMSIVVTAKDGVPIRIRDVAVVTIGHEIRKGAVTANGQGEVMLGQGFMLMGENSYSVTGLMADKMDEIRKTLPTDVEVVTIYERTELVDQVIDTVKSNLADGAILVIAILFIFLGNLRAGLIAAVAIPLSMCFAFTCMLNVGIAGTLLSLGAIDFGIVVDSSVVLLENIIHRLAHADRTRKSRLEIIRDASIEVRQPIIFGQLIIMIVYIPILTLEGVEGKMFQPMALTVVFVLTGSLILSLTVMPVLASLCLAKKVVDHEPALVKFANWAYRPSLRFAIHHRYTVMLGALGALAAAGVVALSLGAEFVPRLSEGAIVIGVSRTAGTDLDESIRVNSLMEQKLLDTFPDEIAQIWSRAGAPEVATDPGGVESTDIFITLNDRKKWKKAKSQTELVEKMEKEVIDFPGQTIWFTQPIEQRINEMISGVRSDVALKLFGDDFPTLLSTAQSLTDVLRTVNGSADLAIEQISGQPILQIKIRRDQIARYGLPATAVLDLVESIGSKPLGEIIEGQLRFGLVVRLPETYRARPEAIGEMILATPAGERVPISRLADIEVIRGPRQISREWGKRRITVQCNVRGRDVGSFVAEAQAKIAEKVKLPDGYRIEWGGQFENMQRAQRRLTIVVPLALSMIVVLLYFTYQNVIDTLCVFTSVAFACVGGIVFLWFRDMPLSISAAVGFITLSGVSVLNSMVFVSAVRELQDEGRNQMDSIYEAAYGKLRTIIMTGLVACVGFMPMAVSNGVGAEVQRPLATVVIGGVLSSTAHTLLVLPILYVWFGAPVVRRRISQEQVNPLTKSYLA